ncbi:hypothetical protein CkaCkLH20_12762 [Colletotrichum karsti]|uniref:HpcH/HpaI aldolase/citrate lyase domain-containing protein n=1 Tax=Colletotrichum karsti TaxID=1095194 RepID=A0A9P6HT74_9PEZI|nr:uncharacterized protein CkaCkLH20_12762 [Colletotrichum karsti]KAF9869719.1 hypothetical protein CkaCkLH20_12762 [Colletotrichum karsti]
MEHSTLSLDEASRHCVAGLQSGITPFVRVPHQCGNGFVQRVLDGGAMGVVFPHIHNVDDAKSAVAISKYPPLGVRSMTGQLPLFDLKPTPVDSIIDQTNKIGSSVILMIETRESVDNVNAIAAIEGIDVLLIGSNDLAIELGVPGDFGSKAYRNALESVSSACKAHGKIFGLAGVYDAPELQRWAVGELGARFILGQQDSGLLASGSKKCIESLNSII